MTAPATAQDSGYNFAYLDEQTKRMVRRAILKAVVPFTARQFARAIIMPNLVPPAVTTAEIVTTSGAVVEWDFSAIQARPMGAISVGTGAEVVTNGVTIIELRGDRIIRAADCTDTAPMMLQVGGRIELPGGTVMDMDRARVP